MKLYRLLSSRHKLGSSVYFVFSSFNLLLPALPWQGSKGDGGIRGPRGRVGAGVSEWRHSYNTRWERQIAKFRYP